MIRNSLFILLLSLPLLLIVAIEPRANSAQGIIDRIVRPCATGSVSQASVIVNPNNTGNIVATTCTGGAFVVNGVPVGAPGGTNQDVQFNDNGVFGGTAGFLFNKNTGQVSIAPTWTSGTRIGLSVVVTNVSSSSFSRVLQLVVNAAEVFGVDKTGVITDAALAGGGVQCLQVDNVGTFSGAACGTISGSGTAGQLSRFTSATALGNSAFSDDGAGALVAQTIATFQAGDVSGAGNGTVLQIDDAASTITTTAGLIPSTVGAQSLGSSAKPFRQIVLGNSTNAVTLNGSAASAPRTVSLPNGTGTLALALTGVTGSIGGGALIAGACASGTVAVSTSTTTMTVSISPNTYPGDGNYWYGYVSSAGTVTVKVCATIAGTPTATTYNVRVIQ